MFYISKDTFDALPDPLKNQALDDTREHYQITGEDMPDDVAQAVKGGAEAAEGEDQENMDGLGENEMSLEDKAYKAGFERNMADEKQKAGQPKTFDEATDKGLAVMIGVAEPKPKKKLKPKPDVADEADDNSTEDDYE